LFWSIQQVEAHRGKTIGENDADLLIDDAQSIIDLFE